MDTVIAILERDDDQQVLSAANALARMLGVETAQLRVPKASAPERAGAVLAALADDHVVAAAMSAHGKEPVCWDVITRAAVPVVVVPRASERTTATISRVLLPLDGSPETAAGVAEVAHRALESGASVVAMHVFDQATVPAFWDQAAHTQQAWTREFLRRNLPEAVDLDLRSGRAAEQVLAEADRGGVDLIVIAWGRDLSTGRASTVRHALSHGLAPVLLVGAAPGPSSAAAGPSPLDTGTVREQR